MRSMRGSNSAVNGFPLIFRVIFRFICTQPLVLSAVYDGDEYFGKMQGGGGGGGALRAPVLGAGFWVLAPVVRDWADLCVEGAIRGGCGIGRTKPFPLDSKQLACKGGGAGMAGAWLAGIDDADSSVGD